MDRDELSLKATLRPLLNYSFVVEEEVEGRFLVDGTRVVIDFLLYPKPELVALGFDESWWGLEVKSPNVKDPKKKGIQRHVDKRSPTAQSLFAERRPLFVAIFPHVREFFPPVTIVRGDGNGTYEANEGHWLKCFLQKANVSSFEVLRNRKDWKIEFGAGSTYFSSTKGRSDIQNIGIRRVVGSWKSGSPQQRAEPDQLQERRSWVPPRFGRQRQLAPGLSGPKAWSLRECRRNPNVQQ